MKKGLKYNIKRYRRKAAFYSGFIVSILGFGALTLISLGNIAVGVSSIIVSPENWIEDLVNIIVSGLSCVVSSVGTIRSIISMKHNCFNRKILKDDGYKEDLKKKLIDKTNINPEYLKNKYKWAEHRGEYYLYSDEVDNALLKRADKLYLNVFPRKQPMSSEQREALYNIVNEKIANGKSIFNSNLVRLRTDLFSLKLLSEEKKTEFENDPKKKQGDKEENYAVRFKDLVFVDVEKTDYYSNLTSNDLIYTRIFKFDYSDIYYGKNMTVDDNYSLYNLSQSPAANIIGVSTIAITNDGYVVVNRQNNNNDVNCDCYVPSGSGSSDFEDLKNCSKGSDRRKARLEDRLDYYDKSYAKTKENKKKVENYKIKSEPDDKEKTDDFDTVLKAHLNDLNDEKDAIKLRQYIKKMRRYSCDFNDFIRYGMARELLEESHYSNKTKKKNLTEEIKKYGESTYVFGYIRILDRGGKPDFFGVTLLDFSKKDAQDRFNQGRIKYAKKESVKKCAITDFNEVCEQRYIPLKKLIECNDTKAFEQLIRESATNPKDRDEKVEVKLSLQIHYFYKRLSELFKEDMAAEKIKQCDGANYYSQLKELFNSYLRLGSNDKK